MITNFASTSHTGLRVLIAGGGIAGLSLARALKDAGHHPLVIEGNTEWPMTGTAHYLPANALRALNGLGIGSEIAAAAHRINRQRVTGSEGRTLVDLPVSSIWGDLGGCAAIRHSALHEILRAATADVPIRLGTTIAAHLSDRAVRLSDGSVEHYDVLVGADGVHSVVRTAGLGGAEPKPTGRWCWRFIANGWDGEDDTWHARLAPGRSLLTVPLGKARFTAMPTSQQETVGRPAIGVATLTTSASRSPSCLIRPGRGTPLRSWKLISRMRFLAAWCWSVTRPTPCHRQWRRVSDSQWRMRWC
jgi:2-polyprenyl-6-methoxyphenol hydroxylase-like FAD-dependent oxidoreductase